MSTANNFSLWARDCCLKPNKQIFSHIMARTSYIRLYDDDVCFVLDKHEFDFYSASSLKKHLGVSV